LIGKGISFGGSLIGPPEMIKEMLDVAVKHNVKSWTTSHPMKEVGQKLKDMDAGRGKFCQLSSALIFYAADPLNSPHHELLSSSFVYMQT
jgi:hypothetical protein